MIKLSELYPPDPDAEPDRRKEKKSDRRDPTKNVYGPDEPGEKFKRDGKTVKGTRGKGWGRRGRELDDDVNPDDRFNPMGGRRKGGDETGRRETEPITGRRSVKSQQSRDKEMQSLGRRKFDDFPTAVNKYKTMAPDMDKKDIATALMVRQAIGRRASDTKDRRKSDSVASSGRGYTGESLESKVERMVKERSEKDARWPYKDDRRHASRRDKYNQPKELPFPEKRSEKERRSGKLDRREKRRDESRYGGGSDNTPWWGSIDRRSRSDNPWDNSGRRESEGRRKSWDRKKPHTSGGEKRFKEYPAPIGDRRSKDKEKRKGRRSYDVNKTGNVDGHYGWSDRRQNKNNEEFDWGRYDKDMRITGRKKAASHYKKKTGLDYNPSKTGTGYGDTYKKTKPRLKSDPDKHKKGPGLSGASPQSLRGYMQKTDPHSGHFERTREKVSKKIQSGEYEK